MPNTIYIRSIKASKFPNDYVVVDFETTGVDISKCQVIEMSALRVAGGEASDEFTTLVSCKGAVPKAATAVNGITKGMLKGAPTIAEAMAAFDAFVGDSVLVGHNCNRFDAQLLTRDRLRLKNAQENDWIDTLEMAKKILPGGYKLSELCERYGIVNERAHRALSDCHATHEVYQRMRSDLFAVSTDVSCVTPTGGKPVAHELDGKLFVFTGDGADLDKREAMQLAADHGATLQNNVTLKTTHLVNLGGDRTGKVQRAEKYRERTGIVVIDERAFEDMVGYVRDETVRPEPVAAVAPSAQDGAKASSSPATAEPRKKRGMGKAAKVALVVLAVVVGVPLVLTFWQQILVLAIIAAVLLRFLAGKGR